MDCNRCRSKNCVIDDGRGLICFLCGHEPGHRKGDEQWSDEMKRILNKKVRLPAFSPEVEQ